jgi:uncharacterized protein (DUF2236 family)
MSEPPPEHDGGVLGPDAVAWRVVGHPGALVGGMRALVVQSLHPLAMAGVAQHSDYERRALDRLRRTAYYVAATVFGDTETAHAAAARVRRMHGRVRGIDPVTGRAYSADDPETQLWVHCVEWHSFLAAHRVFAPASRLTAAEEDRYIAEGAEIAPLLGTPRELVPASVDEMNEYFASVRPQLCISEAARSAIRFVQSPPLTRELLPLQLPLRVVANAAVALVPRHLRRLAGIDRPRPLDAAAIAAAMPLVNAIGLPVVSRGTTYVMGSKIRDLQLAAEAAWKDRDPAEAVAAERLAA